MGTILTEISEGELLDKISILEIKLKEIQKSSFLEEVKKEYGILLKIKKENIKENKLINELYQKLKNINQEIWNIENIKRSYEKKKLFDNKFLEVSRKEYIANDSRAKIKSEINHILDSNIKEIKEHILK
jgi:hypothetical protein|tara:strand:+ start:1161 stop:1550 length:390 start_codon:yes stop_codon:yes gene_type:complete